MVEQGFKNWHLIEAELRRWEEILRVEWNQYKAKNMPRE
jgi:hypothetical protein